MPEVRILHPSLNNNEMENRAKLETLKAGFCNGIKLHDLEKDVVCEPCNLSTGNSMAVHIGRKTWIQEIDKAKPYLFSMEDLTKMITIGGDGFILSVEIRADRRFKDELIEELYFAGLNKGCEHLPYWVVDILIKNHFNVFNLPDDQFIRVTNENSPYK